MLFLIKASFELALIYGLITLAIFITFRVLDYPDMTVDGSFTLGSAIIASQIAAETNPYWATFYAMLGGGLAGGFTGILYCYGKISPIISGILTCTALYSINLRLMGAPNIGILDYPTILQDKPIINLILISGTLFLITIYFFYTDFGLIFKASGKNSVLCNDLGISVNRIKLLGLIISNCLVALSGAIFTQLEGFADISSGFGTIIHGLAALVIGETFLPSKKFYLAISRCFIGTLIYRCIVTAAINSNFLDLKSSDINIVTTFFVICFMLIPNIKTKKVAIC